GSRSRWPTERVGWRETKRARRRREPARMARADPRLPLPPALGDRAGAPLAAVRNPTAAVLDHAGRGLRARPTSPARERALLLHGDLAGAAARGGGGDRQRG